jgi:acyl carrier protein
MWAEVLNLERVGVDDNFFELGGHSLLIVELHSKLGKALDRQLSIIDFFKYPTISSLAAHLDGKQVKEIERLPNDESIETRRTSRKRLRAQRQSAR